MSCYSDNKSFEISRKDKVYVKIDNGILLCLI